MPGVLVQPVSHLGAMEALVISGDWIILARELRASFARSGGPGGQNVNKVSTKVDLRFDLASTTALSVPQKSRFRARYPSLVTQAGEILISCDETRSQAINLERARERLRSLILSIRVAPRLRMPTKPSRASKRRRLEDKRRQSLLKRGRTHLD